MSDSTPAAGEFDAFLRHGRIGPALLADHNRQLGTACSLDECTFSPGRHVNSGTGDDRLRPAIWMAAGTGSRPVPVLVHHLYLVLGRDLTGEERAFFARCDWGRGPVP